MAIQFSLEDAQGAQGMAREWAYNCLDVTGTREVWDVLHPRLSPAQARIYAFERALQAPAMAIMRRGIKVDRMALGDAIRGETKLLRQTEKAVAEREDIAKLWDLTEKRTGECPERPGKKHRWERLPDDDPKKVCKDCGVGRWQPKPFNCNSRQQVEHLFHTLLGVPHYKNRKGEVSYDEEILERIGRKHPEHKPIVDAILEVRGHKKQLGFLGARLGPDGRMYHSLNVGAAWTGRFSASKNPYGLGTNLQNIAERWRHIFVADPGMVIFYADLEQAESRIVAYCADDEKYIEAHLSGDTHTYVCRIVWPEHDWTGDIAKDSKLAKSLLPEWDNKPGHDYRFQAKRIQHGPLSPDMEVLTLQGWCRAGDCPEEIAVWDSNSDIWFEKVSWWEGYADRLVLLDHRNLRQLVSPDHRLPVMNNGKLGERSAGVHPSYGRAPVHGVADGYDAYPPALARLWAAAWADGSLEKAYPNSVRFDFVKERKAERLRKLAAKAGLRLWEGFSDGRWHFRIYGFHEKALQWSMLNWHIAAREALLDELPHWDGSLHNGQRRVFNTDLEGMSIVQAIAHITGMSFAIRKHGECPAPQKQCYMGTISNRKFVDYSAVQYSEIGYGGRVICPVTSAGWVLCRREGVVSVTGNCNYGLQPHGIASIAHIPLVEAKRAYEAYHDGFPGIQTNFHAGVMQRLNDGLPIVNPMGREIPLFGRPPDTERSPWTSHTFKQGLAAGPQSCCVDILNVGMYRIWREMGPERAQLLAQVHDANLGQMHREDMEAARRIVELMTIPVPIGSRVMTIPVEIAVGKSWGKKDMEVLHV